MNSVKLYVDERARFKRMSGFSNFSNLFRKV
ncbi:MAG: hypothetical protein UY73_C0023G0005 [Parcubacteria group bacterium GW2011_GWA2_52_8]|nr:MAG: hypothetical protein UY73_C0023G0005 [Parcubacteria group bacterium GW2011_GWA2_52_8]